MKKLITSLVVVPLFLISPNTLLMSEKYEQDFAENCKISHFDIQNGLLCSEKKNYEGVIDYIKAHEGYADGKEYTCVSGHRTIGYGHVIMPGDKFKTPIDKATADSLLRSDFRKSFLLAEKYVPQLEGSRKLAVAHFIFSKGPAAFLSSGLCKAIRANKSVDAEFAKWCYYTDHETGRKIKSKVGARITKWETAMWHKDDKFYAMAAQNGKRKTL